MKLPSLVYHEVGGVWMYEKIYNIDNFPYQIYRHVKVVRKKNRACFNIPCAFDIESTTVPNFGEPFGFMYIWMFCVGDKVCMGRYWEELFIFLSRLKGVIGYSLDCTLPVYVHYLSFEWQFVKDFFEWDNTFARDKRKVLRCTTTTGIEFRCSYYLSNMSLFKFCEYCGDVPHTKKSSREDEEYVYTKIRTGSTPMQNFELSYCYCDVRGLCECIAYLMKEDNLMKIPMTSTGYVRRDMRRAMAKNPANRRMFLKTALTPEVYSILKDLRRGGNTHGYRGVCGHIIHNVEGYDISSSYPYVMMTKGFPMGRFTEYGQVKSLGEIEGLMEEYCVIFRCVLSGHIEVRREVAVPYITLDKTITRVGVDVFNGRILYADELQLALTEIDWDIISHQYTYDTVAFKDVYVAKRGELPSEFKAVVLDYFEKKTKLKGVDAYMYAKSKNRLNSTFGMSYTDPVRDNWEYKPKSRDEKTVKNGGWVNHKPTDKEALDAFYDSWTSFLPYQWGPYVTAWARYQLELSLRISKNNTVYVDTDSNKVQDMPKGWLDSLNAEIMEDAENHGAYAYDKDGNKVYMGVFEHDATYRTFVTLGAKKYAYEKKNKMGEYEFGITIAGVNPEKGAIEMGNVKNMRKGFVFRYGGGTEVTYNDWQGIREITVNGDTFTTASNVAIMPSTYTVGMTEEFLAHINLTPEDYYI